MEALWRAYYGAVFNPARLNLKAMRAEMPARHWATLPETQLLPALVAAAPRRVRGMLDERAPAPTARPFVPDSRDLDELRTAAATCTGCPLLRARDADGVRRRAGRDRRCCWSANSPATRRTSRARRSSARPATC